MPRKIPAPVPPVPLPPARTVTVAGRGEFFLRDSGLLSAEHAARPAVMLLHGWTANADLNWVGQYGATIAAGYRVLAIDHRGHGRGLRTFERFRLTDCAADAAAVLRELQLTPAVIVGYSMGGAIAQLIARDHADVVAGLVLSGTAQRFIYDGNRRRLRALPLLRITLSLAPRTAWKLLLGQMGWTAVDDAGWIMGEMLRQDPNAIVDGGRELARFDSRPWLQPIPQPSAFVLTTADDMVPPDLQRELIAVLGATVFEAPIRHMQIAERAADYNPALLQALAHVSAKTPSLQVVS